MFFCKQSQRSMEPMRHLIVLIGLLSCHSGFSQGLDWKDAELKEPDSGWKLTLGSGPLLTPAFEGAKTYQLSIVPFIRFSYEDRFFASVQEGIGYDVLPDSRWKWGPILRYRFSRQENDGANPFQVAGQATQALRGLGDVAGTLEAGTFFAYQWEHWEANVQLRKGIQGHEGLVADLGLSHSINLAPWLWGEGPPLIMALGPRATFVGSSYNQSYFGVTPAQSLASGLPGYNPKGGLLSYGLNLTLVAPLRHGFTATFLTGYQRLTGDAADSPLVRLRGSPNQFVLGLFLTYDLGL